MDPRQAAEAAAPLEASVAVPVHDDALNRPPIYAQVPRPAEWVELPEGRPAESDAFTARR